MNLKSATLKVNPSGFLKTELYKIMGGCRFLYWFGAGWPGGCEYVA